MAWVKAVLVLLQIVKSIMDYLGRNALIQEGERRQIAQELAAVVAAGQISKEVRDEISKLTDSQVDDRLGPDFRP